MIPGINPQWGNNLDNAIADIAKFLSFFTVCSEGYNRINVFLKTFKIANGLNYKLEYVDNKDYSILVFVCMILLHHTNNPIVYYLVNRALKVYILVLVLY